MNKNLVVLLLFISLGAKAQDEQNSSDQYSKFHMGFGLGLDYGGIGTRLTAQASRNLGIFAGLGYNFNGLGFNGGVIGRISPSKRVCPVVIGMYGYNAVLLVEGAENYNKTYYGPSIGMGLELKSKRNQNYLSIALLVPMRSSELDKDIDQIKSMGGDVNDPIPIAFSVGYHLAF